MYNYYIVISAGYWGGGNAPSDAVINWTKAGGTGDYDMYELTANLPFTQPERVASKDEATAWVNKYGTLVTKQCAYKKIAKRRSGILSSI